MKPKVAASLEISNGSVKLLELTRKRRNRYCVIHCARHAYDSRAKLGDTIKKTIAESAESAGMSGFLSTSVWSPTLISRKITMPNAEPEKLAETVKAEAAKVVPYSLNDCIIDHFVLGPSAEAGKTDVMFIAAKKDLIFERCRFLQGIGIDLSFVDIHPVALSNLYAEFFVQNRGKTVALIHLGDAPPEVRAEENFMCIVKDGVPHVIRDLGDKLSAPQVAQEAWNQTAAQIMNAAVFYENSSKDKVELFAISGEEKTCGLMAKCAEQDFQKTLERWTIADRLDFANEDIRDEFLKHESSFMVAAGLALRRLKG